MVSWKSELGDRRLFWIMLCTFVCDLLVAKPMLKYVVENNSKESNNFLKYALCLI